MFTNINRLTTLIVILFCFGITVFFIIQSNKTDNNDTVRIGYSPYVVNLPLFIAAEKDLFAKHGLNFKLVSFQSTDQLAIALSSGNIDVASALTAESVYTINANEDKIRPFYFNLFTSDSSVDAIIAKEHDIQNLEPTNLKIGILPADMMETIIISYLKDKYGLLDGYTVIKLPPTSILSGLSSGDLDLVYVLEPLITISKLSLNAKILDTGIAGKTIANPLPAGFHSVRTALVSEQPDLARKLVVIFDEASELAGSEKDLAMNLLIKYCGLSPEIAKEVNLPSWSKWNENLQINLNSQFNSLLESQDWNKDIFQKTHYVISESK